MPGNNPINGSPDDTQANQELVKAHIDQLNQQFYSSFDTAYFRQKSLYLVALIAKPNTVREILKEGVAFKSLKVKTNEQEMKELSGDEFNRNLKAEVAVTYSHAIETLFRLLFAHAATHDCPWVELSTSMSFRRFKSDVNRFTKHKYFIGIPHSEGLSILFFGKKSCPPGVAPERWEKSLNKLSEFLDYYASELLASYAYNSHKHGLAVFNEEFGFNLSDILKVDKDDAMIFLTHEKDKEAPGYRRLYREYVFTKWESKFALTYQLTRILENLISVGKSKYVGGKVKLSMFDEYDLGILIKNDDNPIIPSSIKEGSLSFKSEK